MRVRDLLCGQAAREICFLFGLQASLFPGILIELDEDKLGEAECQVELSLSDLDL
jgi:hypothetical protein